MSSFTTADKRSESDMASTVGAWIREANGDYEVYYDGVFLVAYGGWSPHIAAAAMDVIYDYAFKKGQEHNRKALKEALGL